MPPRSQGLAVATTFVTRGANPWTATAWTLVSNFPQVLVALPSYVFVNAFQGALPVALGFAAGCMVWIVFAELLPDALEDAPSPAVATATTFSALWLEGMRMTLESASGERTRLVLWREAPGRRAASARTAARRSPPIKSARLANRRGSHASLALHPTNLLRPDAESSWQSPLPHADPGASIAPHHARPIGGALLSAAAVSVATAAAVTAVRGPLGNGARTGWGLGTRPPRRLALLWRAAAGGSCAAAGALSALSSLRGHASVGGVAAAACGCALGAWGGSGMARMTRGAKREGGDGVGGGVVEVYAVDTAVVGMAEMYGRFGRRHARGGSAQSMHAGGNGVGEDVENGDVSGKEVRECRGGGYRTAMPPPIC